MDPKQIYHQVQQHYGLVAKGEASQYGQTVAKAFGYTEDELVNTPEDAALGLSCGNPLALAKLREGETVIDLGSGAGFDVFLAAKKVGVTGKVFGIDMNKEMIERANRNKAKAHANNVSFVESAITDIALPDGIADCLISNCVVNLVPDEDKAHAFKEMFRLLRPGGRLAISDILAKKELSMEFRKNIALYVGCIAGASQVSDYEKHLHEAGFSDILIKENKYDLNVYITDDGRRKKKLSCGTGKDEPGQDQPRSCCDNKALVEDDDVQTFLSRAKDLDFNELAASFQIYAVKS